MSVSPSVMTNASLGNGTETNEWLASAMENPLDVGIVLDGLSSTNCGHRLKLSKLSQYLTIDSHSSNINSNSNHSNVDHNNQSTLKTGAGSICPICHAPIVLVEDGVANTNKNSNNDSLLFFKHNKHFYRLSLDNSSKWWKSWWYGSHNNSDLAQRRIANVLHVKSLRILSKGKVIYPDATKSEDELSRMLLVMSQNALDKKSNNNSKPSLVVMGTRIGNELHNVKTAGWVAWMVSASHTLLCSIVKWGFRQLASFRSPLPPPHQD